ncbi:prepilin-type N-terminal cleavage/methylation domain-containing protein [Tatumella sp. TA1]|uniref:prepilin-type N-terminal cleavage/methylation domain-containing protein n=1 Tax=Rosenbergiella collisarenosi TaxID=1544695 RepID=UPI0008F85A93|nr:prepilin-type N-terminal cleavage/methylation domain-containing protein [Rosenbergiella collisarenosi]QGX92283.1 prepilin-type N-terminal cleavage/methylation domain-containing protein [Tatumella sp. TA1]
MPTSPRASQAGFTLLEILIVLLITTILAGLASRSLTQWQQRQAVRASAIDLAHFLNRLRQQASRYHSTVVVAVAPSADNVRVVANSDPRVGLEQHWEWRPLDSAVQVVAIVGEPRFFGKHSTAWPGSIEIGNKAARWRIIISAHGRVRYCQAQDKGCQ